jgi:transcriptional regulator with XRE-family HTH domain
MVAASYNLMLNNVNNPMLKHEVDNPRMTNRRGTSPQRRIEIGQRLQMAIDSSPRYKDETQGAIAGKLGVRSQAVSLWLRGERLPGTDNCIALAGLLNISIDWLLLGRGEMRSGKIDGSELVAIDAWPPHAKDVIRGMEVMYNESDQEKTSR